MGAPSAWRRDGIAPVAAQRVREKPRRPATLVSLAAANGRIRGKRRVAVTYSLRDIFSARAHGIVKNDTLIAADIGSSQFLKWVLILFQPGQGLHIALYLINPRSYTLGKSLFQSLAILQPKG